ncbi:MAG: hypothetical protein GJ680_18235 [Alteromonadaceae bacterium]|nr:hypothetical protein [Alteromonadaceae bacterium]
MNLWHTNKSLRHSVKQIALISTFASATFASVANEGVVFSGQVKTVTPTVTIEADDGAVAHVKDFSLSVIQDALECELYTEVWQTQNSFAEDEKPRCLFEWTGSVNGLTVDSLALEGILNTADTAGFEYQVSILDQGQKRVIVTDTYELPVGSPEISNIVDIVANWSNEQEAGLTQENYDKNNRLTSAFVEVEPRPFTQVVTFRGANCTVEAEQNGCTVTFDSLRPGEGAPESFGSLVEQITATDEKNYLELQTRNFVIDYDYRSPEVVDFVVNGVGEMAPIDYSVDDQDYVLQENKAMLVLRTPHYDKPGDWWFPEVEDIELIIDSTIATEYLVQIKGETYEYEVNSVLARSSYEINPSGEPTIINDKIVFFYDVSGIPDGRFTANIKASDKYNNTREVGIP